jgi:polysaccharide biosynthesis protein PslH
MSEAHVAAGSESARSLRIVWVKTELLHPVDKGGRIRTYQMLRALARRHRVIYVTLDDGRAAADAVERATEYCHRLVRVPFAQPGRYSVAFWLDLLRNLASPLPYAVAKYRSAALRRAIAEACREEMPDLVVCDFLAPSVNVPSDAGVPTLLFQHNVEAAIWQRHASVAGQRLRRAYMAAQWRRMRRFEAAECRRFDHVVAVSPQDAAVFRQDYGARAVSDVPTGVDTEYFRPSGRELRQPRELVFTGSMDWMPNEDAMLHFVAETLPLLRRRVPDVTLTIVGRNPPPRIRALAAADASIRVTGSVPDVRPYLERAAVFIVPIRVGGGTRLKIFEAMAMELPVVSTTIGAEGLPVRDGEDVRLADTPADFADAVAELLAAPDHARTLALAGAALVRAQFGWDHVAARFADACHSVVEGREAPAPALTSSTT